MNNKERQGRFTSSQMHRLLGTPRVRGTYIEEKQIERRMSRCLDVGSYSQSMAWGKYMETRVFRLVGMEYKIASKTTIIHPNKELGKYWSGSPDLIAFKGNDAFKISEIKCFYPKEFAKLTDALITHDVAHVKKTRPKEYWQAASNAALCGVDTAEIISYMPYATEMEEIREDVSNFEGEDLWQYRFIVERGDDVLPILPNDGYYKNLNVFAFTVPEEDILLMNNTVLENGREFL